MKVNHSSKEINEIELHHNGAGLRFRSVIPESDMNSRSTPKESLLIDFHDLSEVDNLIFVLEMFKKNCLKSWEYYSLNKIEMKKDR